MPLIYHFNCCYHTLDLNSPILSDLESFSTAIVYNQLVRQKNSPFGSVLEVTALTGKTCQVPSPAALLLLPSTPELCTYNHHNRHRRMKPGFGITLTGPSFPNQTTFFKKRQSRSCMFSFFPYIPAILRWRRLLSRSSSCLTEGSCFACHGITPP